MTTTLQYLSLTLSHDVRQMFTVTDLRLCLWVHITSTHITHEWTSAVSAAALSTYTATCF